MIETLIVEDEMPALNELKRFLASEEDFHVIAEAQDGETALSTIKRLKPEVVFLDIHIPKRSGLEVAAELSTLDEPPLIVFVTAYDRYAIQAFEVRALDYLLKPYDRERFQATCTKIRETLNDRAKLQEKLIALRDYIGENRPLKLTGHKRNSRDRILIHYQDVLYFSVHLTEVAAHLANGEELIVNGTFKSLLSALDPNRFQQTHRAYIVHLDQVDKVLPLFGGNHELSFKQNPALRIPLSRRYAQKLRKLLKW